MTDGGEIGGTTLILATGESGRRIGGLSLLQRNLHEVARAARAGRLPPRATVLREAGSQPPGLEAPEGLRVSHRSVAQATTLPAAAGEEPPERTLLIAGDLLCAPGALAARLRGGGAPPPGTCWLRADTDAGDVEELERCLADRRDDRPGDDPMMTRIRDDEDAARGSRRLFASLGKLTDGFSARHLNRPISTRLTRLLAATPITPNAFTALLITLMVASAWILARGDYLGFVLGAVLFNLVSILDGCDGELARVTCRGSDRGARLDTMADMAGHHVFVVALGVGLARQPGLQPPWETIYVVEGVLTALGIALTLWGTAAVESSWEEEGHFLELGDNVLDSAELTGLGRRTGLVITNVTRQDTYHWLFIPVAVAGKASWILHGFALGVAGHLVALAYVRTKRVAEARRQETA